VLKSSGTLFKHIATTTDSSMAEAKIIDIVTVNTFKQLYKIFQNYKKVRITKT